MSYTEIVYGHVIFSTLGLNFTKPIQGLHAMVDSTTLTDKLNEKYKFTAARNLKTFDKLKRHYESESAAEQPKFGDLNPKDTT